MRRWWWSRCGQQILAVVPLPTWASTVRAGPSDCPAPLHSALGGDLLLAVEAVRPVLVVLIEFLGSQFQAVGASGHQGRVVGVDRGHAL